jgi:tetratricopeptide (TPR) repeat protein
LDARTAIQVPAGDPDALYKDRENLASARQAAGIWEARLTANPRDFESAARLSQARYWLGTNGLPESERKAALEAGIAAARSAIAIDARRPDGHFWLAANMGALAESFGLRQGIKYRGQIKDALLATLKIDHGFLQGSADRALGRWYYKVPGLFGGSNKKSEEHLRKSLTYAPQSTASHFFLAETLFELDRDDEARAELQRVLDAPIEPGWEPEDREFKAKAMQRLRGTNPKLQAPSSKSQGLGAWDLELGISPPSAAFDDGGDALAAADAGRG